jgi:hypothetical protein
MPFGRSPGPMETLMIRPRKNQPDQAPGIPQPSSSRSSLSSTQSTELDHRHPPSAPPGHQFAELGPVHDHEALANPDPEQPTAGGPCTLRVGLHRVCNMPSYLGTRGVFPEGNRGARLTPRHTVPPHQRRTRVRGKTRSGTGRASRTAPPSATCFDISALPSGRSGHQENPAERLGDTTATKNGKSITDT